MEFDLRRGLQDLGRQAGADAGDLPVTTLLRRAHRRRAAVTTAYGAVGAGTVTALAFGGVALLDRQPEPPVAVDPTPTPTTTPSPAATPSATPSATSSPTPTTPPAVADLGADPGWTDAWSYCGGVVEGSTEGGPEAAITATPGSIAVGEEWGGAVTISAPETEAGLQVSLIGPFAISAEGWIVGVPRSAPHAFALTPDGTGEWTLPVDGRLASCVGAPAGAGGTESARDLAAGTYRIAGFLEVTDAESTVLEPVFGQELTIIGAGGAAVPTTPTSILPTLRLDVLQADPAPLCGQPYVPYPTPGPYPGSAVNGTAQLRDGELVATVTLLNAGRNADSATLDSLWLQVVRDGRIVGDVVRYQAAPLGPWPTGAGLPVEVSLGQLTCTFAGGEPWPAGTYEVYASATVQGASTWSTGADGGPWTFTLP